MRPPPAELLGQQTGVAGARATSSVWAGAGHLHSAGGRAGRTSARREDLRAEAEEEAGLLGRSSLYGCSDTGLRQLHVGVEKAALKERPKAPAGEGPGIRK